VRSSRRTLFRRSIGRDALVQGVVTSVIVVVGQIVAAEPAQMKFIQRNDVVESFSAGAAHPSFGDTVLPGLRKLVRMTSR